jgi:hypothetical protein
MITAVEYKKIPVQKPGPDEVLINIKYSGVCHTDLHAINGDWPLPTKLPLVGGHEGAGVVVAKGDLVKDIEVGDYGGVKVSLNHLSLKITITNLRPVDQWILLTVRFLSTGRRTTMRRSSSLRLHSRRNFSAILYRQGCSYGANSKGV